MSNLRNLPLDILLCILDHLTSESSLTAVSLVAKVFLAATTPLLYRSISVVPRKKWTNDQVTPIYFILVLCKSYVQYRSTTFLPPSEVAQTLFVDSVSIAYSPLSCRHTDARKEIRKFDPIEFPLSFDPFCTDLCRLCET